MNLVYDSVKNHPMREQLLSGEAVDVSKCPNINGHYDLTHLTFDVRNPDWTAGPDGAWLNISFCDAELELWIQSIGRHKESGKIQGTTRGAFYDQSPAYECLHLRS